MTAEAIMLEDSGLNPTIRTIADGSAGTTILKGTLMVLADLNVVAASSGIDEFGGILAADKVNGDGSTTVGCHMNGVFDLTMAPGGASTPGEQMTLSGANIIRAATTAEVQLGQFVGYANETGGSDEVISVTLRGG